MNGLYALILAGGSGTRLWPVSRRDSPKQFMSIGGELSLLQETVRRIGALVEPDRMVLITSREFEERVKDQLWRLLGESSAGCVVVGEPAGRNTAPAVLLGARIVQDRDPDALLLVAPSDHIIRDTDAFVRAIEGSLQAASSGMVVTYGIKPTSAETGYGYIRAGRKKGKVYEVERFEEKPTLSRAEELIRDSKYTWNSGIFLFSVPTLMEEAEQYLPAHYGAVKGLDLRSADELDETYRDMEPISIDHGIMEKTKRAAVMPVSMDWSDLGSWDSCYEAGERDLSGNMVNGDVVNLENERCLIVGGGRLLAVTGMRDTIVVQTEDATLVCPRGRSQEVRQIVERLEDQDRIEGVAHRTALRPWGSFTVLEEGSAHKVKRIVVDAGQRLSLQMHRHRQEHWIVVEGEGVVTVGDGEVAVGPETRLDIPVGTRHRAQNTGSTPLVIIEVQFGTYLGEDDIIRFEDDYGRIK